MNKYDIELKRLGREFWVLQAVWLISFIGVMMFGYFMDTIGFKNMLLCQVGTLLLQIIVQGGIVYRSNKINNKVLNQ